MSRNSLAIPAFFLKHCLKYCTAAFGSGMRPSPALLGWLLSLADCTLLLLDPGNSYGFLSEQSLVLEAIQHTVYDFLNHIKTT